MERQRSGAEPYNRALQKARRSAEKLRFIHIAGTNGKGSVSAMLYSVLNAAGVRAGLFTSPYLVKFNERMSALGHDISDSRACIGR